jgi:hypothetical protein
MGAVYLQSGVCLLPKTDDHLRRLKMIENDVGEAKGECVPLEAIALDRVQEDKVIARFKADRDEAYPFVARRPLAEAATLNRPVGDPRSFMLSSGPGVMA